MPVRRQYSSCDSCRTARIGCDAARTGSDGCSNCIRRRRNCTFTWRSGNRQSSCPSRTALATPESPLASTTPAAGKIHIEQTHASEAEPESKLHRRQNALALHTLLWDIFTTLFEPQLGLWIGNDCCPFKHLSTAPKTLISRLLITLDDATSSRVATNNSNFQEKINNAVINNALIRAVHAFCARWLTTGQLVYGSNPFIQESVMTQESQDKLSDFLWHRARQDMYTLLARPSYRSSLALYLFGITPVSPQNPEARFSDVCRYTSLSQLKELRGAFAAQSHWNSGFPSSSTIRSEYYYSGVGTDGCASIFGPARAVSQYRQMEDTAYWFGIVCDVSRCLLNDATSVLLPPGPSNKFSNNNDLSVWQLVRQQIDEFNNNYGESLRQLKFPLSEEITFKVLCHGSAQKTLCWWTIVKVRDAILSENASDSTPCIQEAIEQCVEEITRFEDIFGLFLDHFIMRDYLFLKDDLKVSVCMEHLTKYNVIQKLIQWHVVLLTLHFHLGVLVLLDLKLGPGSNNMAIIMPDYSTHLLNSALAIVNLIRMALSPLSGHPPLNGRILLLDPYPEHISQSLWYAGKAILSISLSRGRAEGGSCISSSSGNPSLVPPTAVESMFSVVFSGLSLLQTVSFSARERLGLLQQLYVTSGYQLPQPKCMTNTNSNNNSNGGKGGDDDCHLSPPPTSISAVQTAEGLTDEITTHPNLITDAIERSEKVHGIEQQQQQQQSPFLAIGELEWNQFDVIGGQWEFSNCFANI